MTADGSPWEKEVLLADGSKVHLIAEDADTLRITHGDRVLRLRKEAGALVALDEEDQVLSIVREADGGAIERVDAEGNRLRVEAWELAAAAGNLDALAALASSR